MKLLHDATNGRWQSGIRVLAGIALAVTLIPPVATAQTEHADPKPSDGKPASPEIYQTFFLSNVTAHDANDLITDLRNVMSRARIYYVPSRGMVSVRGTPEDIQTVQKVLAEADRVKRMYRVTYSITELDGDHRTGTQHYTLVVVSGASTQLKQGNRVPITTAGSKDDPQSTQVQYVDVGLNIDAELDGFLDGAKLRSKIEQSSVAEEKWGIGAQDPVIRQSTLDVTSMLVPGKPLVLGSIDVPGSTRHEEIEVVVESVK